MRRLLRTNAGRARRAVEAPQARGQRKTPAPCAAALQPHGPRTHAPQTGRKFRSAAAPAIATVRSSRIALMPSGARWSNGAAKNGHAKHNGHPKHNGAHAGKSSSNGSRLHSNGNAMPTVIQWLAERRKAKPLPRARLATATEHRQSRRRSASARRCFAIGCAPPRRVAQGSALRKRVARRQSEAGLTAGAKAGNSSGMDLPRRQNRDEEARMSAEESRSASASPYRQDHHRYRRAGRRGQEHHRPPSGPPLRPAQPRNRGHVSRLRSQSPSRRIAVG